MSSPRRSLTRSHAFVVRIWWESGLRQPDGHLLWRGRVQHVTSGEYVVFQSLGELIRFIQTQTGDLERMQDVR